MKPPWRKRWIIKHWDDAFPHREFLLHNHRFVFKRNAEKKASLLRMKAHYGLMQFTKQYEVEKYTANLGRKD